MVTAAHVEEVVAQAERAVEEQRQRLDEERSRLDRLEQALSHARALLEYGPDLFGGANGSGSASGAVPAPVVPTMRQAIQEAIELYDFDEQFTVNDILEIIVDRHPQHFNREQRDSLSSMVSKIARSGGGLAVVQPGGPSRPAIWKRTEEE